MSSRVYAAVTVGLLAVALVMSFPDPDAMFLRFPRSGKVYLPQSKVTVDVPYHNYESDTLLVHGWVEPAAVKQRLQNSAFHPVVNELNGKSLATFWVVDYKNTSINPYKELVVVYIVSTRPDTKVRCATIHCINVIAAQPDIRQYIDKLWLDEDLPIEYGRHLLGCDKYKADIQIERSGNVLSFDFKDQAKGDNLLQGKLSLDAGMLPGYLAHLPFLIYEMGVVKATFFVINPSEFIRWAATGPPGVAKGLEPAVPLNASPLWDAVFVTAPRFTWAAPGDELTIGDRWASLKFQPVLYQHDTSLKAVLLGAWGFASQPKE